MELPLPISVNCNVVVVSVADKLKGVVMKGYKTWIKGIGNWRGTVWSIVMQHP